MRECIECGRNEDELDKSNISFVEDSDLCEECHEQLMAIWEIEQRQLEKYWKMTRL